MSVAVRLAEVVVEPVDPVVEMLMDSSRTTPVVLSKYAIPLNENENPPPLEDSVRLRRLTSRDAPT